MSGKQLRERGWPRAGTMQCPNCSLLHAVYGDADGYRACCTTCLCGAPVIAQPQKECDHQ